VGILSPTGVTTFTVTFDENNAGTVSMNTIAGTYTVASNGRVTLTGGMNPPVIYVVSANKGFLVGTDTSVIAGSFEPQSGGPFTNASVVGNFAFGDVSPTVSAGTLSVGVVTANGAIPTGTINGTSDNNSSGTLTGGQTFSDTYVVAPSGRTTTGSGNNLLYIVSGTKAVLMNTKAGKANSTITLVEK